MCDTAERVGTADTEAGLGDGPRLPQPTDDLTGETALVTGPIAVRVTVLRSAAAG